MTDCPVCIEPLQKDSHKFIRYTCCGQGIHIWCDEKMKKSSLSVEQKNSCPMCRTKHPYSDEEVGERLRPWVEKEKAWAQHMLGNRYEHGLGVEQSDQQAVELYELAASQGHVSAQYNLGQMYYKGQGVDQSYERAKEFYEAAERQGDADAQFILGVINYNGDGVEQSNEKAREWWMKSAKQGHEDAIKNLQVLDKIEGKTTPSFIPQPFECANCYKPGPGKRCGRCKRVFYCGSECQVKHWKEGRNGGHKNRCNKKKGSAGGARRKRTKRRRTKRRRTKRGRTKRGRTKRRRTKRGKKTHRKRTKRSKKIYKKRR